MESPADSTLSKWTAAQCPFTIEYPPRVIDDIRLAVVDAFFSLPRGGAEIGGILLGAHEQSRLTILDSVPIECEHAFGPSFTLSPHDLAKLGSQLAALPRRGNGRPVGWYHSHTRSGIFLSETDLEIYRRFFPEAGQVALVLRPHSFERVRAGFFFREADGSVHASASYQEFPLDPLPVQPAPVAHPPAAFPPPQPLQPPQPPRRPSVAPRPVIDTAPAMDAPRAVPEPAPEPRTPVLVEPPRFATVHARSSRGRLAFLAVLVGLGLGAAGYQTRERWLPRVIALTRRLAPAPPPAAAPAIGLTAVDASGQLLIRWDRNSPAIRKSTGALLMIADGGGAPQAMGLDAAHLQAGSFTYGRQTGQVDVTLTVHQPDGAEIREVTTFLGQPPVQALPVEDPEVRKQRDALAERATKLQTDLNKQAVRTRKLEKNLDEMRLEMRRKRMENQIPDPGKK